MATITEALRLAVEHQQAGRLELAAEIYRRILSVEPEQPDALHLLGLVAQQSGRYAESIDYIQRAIALQPANTAFHNDLGISLQEVGKLDEAVACYRRTLELDPCQAEACNNLGIALQDLGKLDEAVASLRNAVRIEPEFAEGHNNLGVALREQGNLDEAIACYLRATELRPDFAEAHNNLAIAFKDLGNLDQAVACLHRALQSRPHYAEAHSNLGNTLMEQGKCDEALTCYQNALHFRPDYFEAHDNLGIALKDQGRLSEAINCHRRAIEIRPDYTQAHSHLGNALQEQGRSDEALACCRRAMEMSAGAVEAHSNYLRALQYRAGATLRELWEAAQEFDRRHAAALRSQWPAYENERSTDRPLRLGFVSPDFGRHPVGYFLLPVLENLDRSQAETICYNDWLRVDDLTEQLRGAASDWQHVYGLTDEQLAARVRADRIDILFDLAGHTAGNRLLTFARKPAPVQITWMGDAGTTGVQALDYILADQREIPPDAESYYVERVLRLPEGYVCYRPPTDAPAVSALPALSTGAVTFGCFGNPAKLTPRVVDVWSEILRRVPGSRLLLKYRGLGDVGTQHRFVEKFVARGIAAERVELQGRSPHAELLGCYARVDLALDTFPYSGGLTTCEALWMGVPTVTCPGETFASRHSLTHLHGVGLAEQFVADDFEQYVELAVGWASRWRELAELRAGLRQRMRASPLCDGRRFAAHLLGLLRSVWRKWIDGA